jgi:hypothetical protein
MPSHTSHVVLDKENIIVCAIAFACLAPEEIGEKSSCWWISESINLSQLEICAKKTQEAEVVLPHSHRPKIAILAKFPHGHRGIGHRPPQREEVIETV